MTNQQKALCIVIVLLVSMFSCAEYTYWTTDYDATTTTHLVTGKVEDAHGKDYPCGSKGRYSCFAGYVVINGNKYEINEEAYKTTDVGDIVSLNKVESVPETFGQKIAFITHVLLVVIILVVLGFFILSGTWWALCHSNTTKYIDYLKEL